MAYKVSNTLTTTNGNTYANVDEWMRDHGPCGTQSPLVIDGSLTLLNNTTVRCVKVFANQADHESLKASKVSQGRTIEYTVSDISKETI